MGRVTPERHQIDFGEPLAWTPPAATGAFYVWSKIADADAAMRWRRLAGWDVANGAPIVIADAPTGVGLQLTAPAVSLDWPALLALFDGFDNEILQITAHDGDGAMLSRDVYLLPPPTATNAATIAAQERRVLKSLIARREATYEVAGIMRVSSADGSGLEREPIAVLDRRIAEVRARIAWFEAAAAGNALPRQEFW